MNKCYRLVWNDISQCWVAAAETARGRGKRSSGTLLLAAAGVVLTLPVPSVWAAPPNPPGATQLPTGGQVVAGQAGIAQAANTLTVTQSSNRAAIDWATFNVGSQARVQFNQPSSSSVTLNRVLDANPSQIFGQLSANGQVFLSNPAGVYFSPGASVDVGGLVATTHGISNADFMAGGNSFTRNGALGSVVNEGQLSASLGGYIALLAPEVRNSGVVVAQMGTVALAAGESYALQFTGNRLTDVLVTPATIAALVDNGNAVKAPGGLIILSAQAANRLQGGVVNNSGSLEASGLVGSGGTIRLAASDRITHSGSIVTDAAYGSAGTGGTVSLIADLSNDSSLTEVSGSISARGGDAGGDGGFIETSASTVQIADSARFDTSASLGLTGTWLLDPKNFTIASGNGGTVTAGTPSGDISGTTLSTALGTGNVSFDVETSALSNTAVGNAPITITHFNSFTAGGSASFASQSAQDGVLSVTPRAASIATSAVSKVYDGALATSGATLSLTNRVGADDIGLSGNGFYADKNVGSAKDYSFTNLALDGTSAGNYYLASNTLSGSNASITPRTLTISGSTVANKVYDGTDAATAVSGTLGGLVGTETLLASVTSAQFADAHAGTAKAVVWDYALADGSNGGLASDSSTADITPKTLSATLTNSGVSKVYDGSSASDLTPAFNVSGFIAGDSAATLSHSSANYNSAHVQGASSVTVAGLAINAINGSNGSLASDYALDSSALSLPARITPRAVTVTADAQHKTQGQSDPRLSYQSEAQNGNRGRLAGDTLAGSLSRAVGENPASYAILQGSVDNNSNPNYAIDFVPAQLLVEAGVSNIAPPPPASRPTDPVIQRNLPDLRPKSDPQLPPDGQALPATEGSDAALPIDGTRGGIAVAVVRETAQQQEGIINVSVPREMVNAGSGFRFPLPDEVSRQAEGAPPLQVTTLAGEDLPGWLHYDADSRSFVAVEVPLGVLPLRVLVRSGRARWVVVVTERNT